VIVRLSRPGTNLHVRPGEIEILGLHHMIASSILWQNFMPLGKGDPLKRGGKRSTP